MVENSPEWFDEFDSDLDQLEHLSNSVLDLIAGDRLDDAEAACHELRRRFPDVIDWLDRAALVHEARGNLVGAIECRGRCLEFIAAHPDGFDDESSDWHRAEIARLEALRHR